MLPGFRFLFAAIVLSVSLLIFGLGAAALLRAAHEEFATIPSRRPPPEIRFAQRDDAGQTLAMLRVEPSAADEKAMDPPPTDRAQDQSATVSTPAEAEKPATEPDATAALTAAPLQNSSSEAPTSDAAPPEIPIQAETQTETDASSSGAETKFAAVAEMTPTMPDQSAKPKSDQASTPIDESTRIAQTRIATLGGPPVTVESRTPSRSAAAVIKKPLQAMHAVKRRKILLRARVARPAPRPLASPFGTPFGS
jgi:hypothetical protein